jgi:hypothetical protein
MRKDDPREQSKRGKRKPTLFLTLELALEPGLELEQEYWRKRKLRPSDVLCQRTQEHMRTQLSSIMPRVVAIVLVELSSS